MANSDQSDMGSPQGEGPAGPGSSDGGEAVGVTSVEHNDRDHLLSWWLGAALVGADIGTSVFYSTGILFPFVAFASPLIILVVCLLMWLFKSTYEEGCSVSPFNGGAYIMVLQTVGKRLAILVGALTILSYLATAAVSALSGAYYLGSLSDTVSGATAWPLEMILIVAILPVVVFGLLNIVGIREPAFFVFIIAFFHFTLLLYIDVRGLWMALEQQVDFSIIFRGLPAISPINLLHGFAAAFLGITGFESAAQIVEQLKTPTWRTLKKIYLSVVILVTITAPLTSCLCMVLLSPEQIAGSKTHLLSELAYVENGSVLKYILIGDAGLTLFAAVNTAYVGCIGLCTTMAKQGNLPALMLRRWDHWLPACHGYPFVVLPFMAITVSMVMILPGQLEALGQVYGIAFLAVMSAFCLGVIMLRYRMPLKVLHAPFKTSLTFKLGGTEVPLPPLLGLITLLIAEVVLICTAEEARSLGLEILLLILLVMCFYRLGVLEDRLSELADLRLGLGRFAYMDELPGDLPVYVLCTAGAKARRLVTSLLRLLEREEPGPREIIIFHAEQEEARRGMMYELLQRVVSQQVATAFQEQDIILTVKIMPEKLVDGLIILRRSHPFQKVFIGASADSQLSKEQAVMLEDNLGVPVTVLGNIVIDHQLSGLDRT